MDEKFKFTEEQKNFIKQKMGVSDITDVRLIFEVDSIKTISVLDTYSEKSAKYSYALCSCGDGSWSWLCC